jgi:hypothetical protein
MNPEILQLGALGIILFFAIKEFFSYLKTRKNGVSNGVSKDILKALEEQNENHLKHINEDISGLCNKLEIGNKDIVKAITDMHTELAGVLGEIKGLLSK